MTTDVKFVLGGSKYDQNTFFGRYCHFLNVIDPRTLFTSNEKLQQSKDLLDAYKNNTLAENVTNTQLWEAQKIKQAIIHPDTGNKIFSPFRMSGFVPYGAPIVVGLLIPTQSLATTAFWQWLNQSHNACVNYANRNATQKTTTKDFLMGYTGAVTSAVGIALGLNMLIKKSSGLTPSMRTVIQRFIPFPAVATASVCNVVLMRYNELNTGINVQDSQGNVVGVSKVAAKKALQETSATRAFLPAPVLLIPSTCISLLERTNFFRRFPRMHLPVNAALVTLSFGCALPIAIALFPQISSVPTESLEASIQAKTNDKVLYYNKGL